MLKQTLIPESALPINLEPANTLRIRYRTNILFPRIGPIATARYAARFIEISKHFAETLLIVNGLKQYRARYQDEDIQVPSQVERLNVFNPVEGTYTAFIRANQAFLELESNSMNAAPGNTEAGRALYDEKGLAARSTMEAGQLKTLDKISIVRSLTVPNMVMRDLYSDVLQLDGPVIKQTELLTTEKPALFLAKILAQGNDVSVPEENRHAINNLMNKALKALGQTSFSKLVPMHKDMQELFLEYLWRKASESIVLPDSDECGVSREWAFQRHEELLLALGTPILRGPIQAMSVAPKSRLTVTETQTETIREENASLNAQARRLQESQSLISANRFEQALSNLSEYGISDANSFSQDSTLLATLSEERRMTIETVAREISNSSETLTRSFRETATGRATEYRTEGKDEKLATTELAFQVVVPARATVWLRNVGLVWCPYINSPFLELHQMIDAYERDQKAAYIAQHYVPQPIKPVLKTNVRIETFEVQIDGIRKTNMKSFVRTFEFTDPNTFIDLDGITAKHRNATSSDFDGNPFGENGWEAWNWDDLEHAVARLTGLRLFGWTLSGNAILEANDPELLNRSFITISVPIHTYTAETVAALQAYEQAKPEREFKAEAVRVRAAQFAKLKRDELIQRFENQLELRDEAFHALIRRIFQEAAADQLSYYEEVISRCIEWPESKIIFESQPLDQLPSPEFAPNHFMNCPAIRFFMPIKAEAESVFFGAIKAGGTSYFDASVEKVNEFLKDYRGKLAQMIVTKSPKLKLDEFDTEMIIGKHLEAVLSKYEFSK